MRRLETIFNSTTNIRRPDRVQIPRIATTTAGTLAAPTTPINIFMSYYDGNHTQNPVIFRYGTYNGLATETVGGTNSQVYTNNALTGSLTPNATGTGEAASSTANRQVVAINTGTSATYYRGSIYTAVGGLKDGTAVVAWHCSRTRSLVLSYNATPATTKSTGTAPVSAGGTANTWQGDAIVIDSDFAGWHVDMAIDGDDGIHLAYYNSSNGGLRYAYGKFVGGVPVFEDPVRVDTFLSAGTKLMINTRQEKRTVDGVDNVDVQVPYISYFHASFPQTQNSVRVAWRVNFDKLDHGTYTNDRFTGAWEAMTVPSDNVPQDDFVCNGVPSSTGTLVNTFGGNLTNNTVLLGYHTDRYYERAILKK